MTSTSHGGATSQRSARLAKLFTQYTTGKKTAHTSMELKLFLEAIVSQENHAACVEHLVASSNAMQTLQAGLRFDTSKNFFNNHLKDFLVFLSDDKIRFLCGGELLKKLITIVVRPPTLWTAFVQMHSSGDLTLDAQKAFAWLLLELLSWTEQPPVEADDVAQKCTASKAFLKSEDTDLRSLGYHVQHVLQTKSACLETEQFGPGGRHDNDHADYRKITICPTTDELLSTDRPFYRRADALAEKSFQTRPGVHLDNQFRLLREDFLAELRDDINASQGRTKGKRPRTRLQGLALAGIYCGTAKFKTPVALALSVAYGLERLAELPKADRKGFLRDHPKYLKHQSFGYVLDGDTIVTFATLVRADELITREDPLIALRTSDTASTEKLLLALKTSEALEFVTVDTPVFAYEPVLQCLQSKVELPLWQELLAASEEEIEGAIRTSEIAPLDLADDIEAESGESLDLTLSLPSPVSLDASQLQSLLTGLRQSVSLVQGPPGTGKSFIGALLAKALHNFTSETILVICYTNHALDQFLEDILDNGIPDEDIVRLGSKSTPRTEQLSLSKQIGSKQRAWDVINSMNDIASEHLSSLNPLVQSLTNFNPEWQDFVEYLEFSEDDGEFYAAFQMPENEEGMTMVGEDGKPINERYLFDRWRKGANAGVLQSSVQSAYADVWAMDHGARQQKLSMWTEDLLQERIAAIGSLVSAYNGTETTLREAWDQKDTEIIQQKRIIACTTTAAAKYTKQLHSAKPGIVIVEEAGEILESHVLTAMTPHTKQLILIGDHQQLRPKVNNYGLTVEKGDGFDLNRSLFERLVLAGYPHTTLQQQHRMCPEISNLIRTLTYPELIDAPSTLGRAAIRGLSSRVIFVDHRHPELAATQIADRKDEGASISKQNEWEVSMVLKMVRYMAQQGYGTADQVVLTPYLGQLSLLNQELARDNDPVLNDLDSFDLVRAGLLSTSSAAKKKRPIKISTIDNYQGEESDVVIATLTRSNKNGDIGFMASPERLNVLLSRARSALIIIGNSETFLANRRGQETWRPFFDQLAKGNLIHDGLPAKCERHPQRQILLAAPEDFDKFCPDGGCSEPCGVLLSCGLHECPRKCHMTTDHSKAKCQQMVSDRCPKKHTMSWRCSALRPASCPVCDAEARAIADRKQRDEELDKARQQRQEDYAARLAEAQNEIDHYRRLMRDRREDQERERSLRQQQKDLESVRNQAAQRPQHIAPKATEAQMPPQPETGPSTQPSNELDLANDSDAGMDVDVDTESDQPSAQGDEPAAVPSEARSHWEYEKKYQNAKNEELDTLMGMVGLEKVKTAFLDIKNNVDTAVRQSRSLAKERFGIALLGNPGTGKTTVARLYAKFLASVGALPGSHFVETTGAKAANEGVNGCKKMIDEIQNNGGGALFIDEAYQLTSGANMGGSAVLDYLLAEVENLTGKVVFILAGYNKQMESFFAHNPGLPSRFPHQLQFADYEDNELLEILDYGVEKTWEGRMRIEDGSRGLYARIAARRIGYGRGNAGFGNARAVENELSKIISRQATRLRRERRQGQQPDDMLLTKTDIIGNEPADVLNTDKAWKKLQGMVGLASVKESVEALFSSLQYNYQRELAEAPLMEVTLNKVFLGSPGTGKTTVAKLYGQTLANIGLLSTDEVIVKTPADFIGNVIGASEANTKAILDTAIGKVLVIDEAYGLYAGNGVTDPYKTAIIDTIVAEVQSVPGDDRCVLLLGYTEQMQEMMQNVNPGLTRRFPLDSAFHFEDFTDEELGVILDLKLKAQGFKVTEKARVVAMEMLARARNRPHFGNGGEIDILLNAAKIRQQTRFTRDGTPTSAIFEAEDFDPDHQRAERAITNVAKLFEGVVGCEGIVAQLQGYQTIVANMKQRGLDPRPELPFNFLFRGPPGTGKTSTARKMGKVFYDMGFLANAKVEGCSAKDMIAEYVGQTGPKTQKLVKKALGSVLFIDEAYRLADPGPFTKEAVDELVDCITKPRFQNKLVIILAGYENDINRLMNINPGLTSRFPEVVDFQSLSPEHCLDLLHKGIAKKKHIDCKVLAEPRRSFRKRLLDGFTTLSSLANFANGRDVETLAKAIVGDVMKRPVQSGQALAVTEGMVTAAMDRMIAERMSRASAGTGYADDAVAGAPQSASGQGNNAPRLGTVTATTSGQGAAEPDVEADDDEGDDDSSSQLSGTRDAGVTDAVWNQLQSDIRKAAEEEQERLRLAREEEELRQWLRRCEDAARQRKLALIERRRRELEERKREEAKAQALLAQMGVCPMGYTWIRQAGGYRCAGGSHWMSDGEVARMSQ